jgi:hypothetical protein
MDLGQRALLGTVDRLLREQGDDPAIITPEDKIVIAAQHVQLCQLHEHELRSARRKLASALGVRPDITLEELISDAAAIIGEQRSHAA